MDKRGDEGDNPPITGVFFDLGGTLCSYRERRQMGQAGPATLRRLGFDTDAPEVRAAMRAASEQVQTEYAERRSFLHTDFFCDRITRAAAILGVEMPAAVLKQFAIEHVANIVEHMPIRPEAMEALEGLKSRGLYQAVVSNADDSWLDPIVRRHNLDSVLDDWTSSEEAASCKPDAGIYNYALSKAGLSGDQALFVGDSVPHDITGAHAVGMRSALIVDDSVTIATPLGRGLAATAEPDFQINQLTELLGIVDEINGRRD